MYTSVILKTYGGEADVIYCWHLKSGDLYEDAEELLKRVMSERWKERNPDKELPEVITDDDISRYQIHLTFRGRLDPIVSDDADFYDFTGD